MKFEELYWHDSVIKNIEINRLKPGEQDMIVFDIDWSDIGPCKLIFKDVYRVDLKMNFGIKAEESIDDAYESSLINNYNIKLNVDKELYCYVIKTASSGSEIKIIAGEFKLVK